MSYPHTDSSDSGSKTVIRQLLCSALCSKPYLVIAGIGCGGSGAGPVATPTPPPQPLTVTQQPVSQAVKLGDPATFSVVVSGTGLVTYQWQKNGMPINGATSPSYTTPPTTEADNDSVFNVVVIEPGSTILPTNKARLVLNPPKPGDLRFQEVDAPATLNNYNLALLSNIDGGLSTTWNGYGSPLVFSAFGQCAGGTDPTSCSWGFLGFSSSGLTTKYQGHVLSSFSTDLAALGADEVVASLDFESFNNAYAMVRVKSNSAGGFSPSASHNARQTMYMNLYVGSRDAQLPEVLKAAPTVSFPPRSESASRQ